MGRYLIINDEQHVLRPLFGEPVNGSEAVDFAVNLDDARALGRKNRYDTVLVQVGPLSPILGGRSLEDFVATVTREFQDAEVLWAANFEGLRGTAKAPSFGASDFVISGSLLRDLICGSARGQKGTEDERSGLRRSIVALANVFQSLIDLEDPFLKGNIHFLVECSRGVALALGLSRELVAATELASCLYDVGKIGLNKDILWKKSGLNQRQQNVMHTHPIVACELLKDVPFPWDVLPIIRHHHERFDGTGYPQGLKGREIPIGARIIAVVDAFHAMTSLRPYRRGLSLEDAFSEIGRHAGSQFDPEVVEAFFGVAREYFSKHPARRSFSALLVDDDIKDLTRLKMALELEGYEVSTARTFGQAEKALENAPPDLIIAELCLTDGDGFAFLDAVRQIKDLDDTLFMFVSSRTAQEDRLEAYRKGVDDFLGKPYQVSELVLKLGNLLRRIRRRQESVPRPAKNALVGTLEEFSLPDLLQILDFGVKTALVTVSNGSSTGKIYVDRGKVKYVILDSRTSHDALLEMFGWDDGGFSIEHGVSIDKKNVSMDSPMLILDTLQKLDEHRRNGNGSSSRAKPGPERSPESMPERRGGAGLHRPSG